MSEPVLLYDANCGFCMRAVGLAPRLGLRARVVALQSVNLAALGVSATRAAREIPFVDVRGTVSYGAPAIAGALATGDRWWRAVARAMRRWPLRPTAAAIYRVVADHRHRLPGGTAACAVPADDVPRTRPPSTPPA